jgi:flagellar protein FlaJ
MAKGNQNFFAKIGDLTINSAQKTTELAQIPVAKASEVKGKVNSKFNKPKKEKKPSKLSGLTSKFKGFGSKSDSDSESSEGGLLDKIKTMGSRSDSSEGGLFNKVKGVGKNSGEKITSFRPQQSASKLKKRMKMNDQEIEVFKSLVQENKSAKDKKAEKEEEKKRKKQEQQYQKASLEGLLEANENDSGVDPKLIMGGGILVGLIFLGVTVFLGMDIMIGAAIMLLIVFAAIVMAMLPKLKSGGSNAEAARELPFALRQMSTELKSGIGLHDSMRSIANAGYGPLSEEFARTLEEIKYGETTENALNNMAERMNSEGMTRAVHQITRTLGSGGDLAKTLTVIADDLAYEMRMKLNDYAQKLNSFTMIYMFIAVLGPVILLIMLMAATNVMKTQLIPDMGLILIYLVFFPAIVAFIILLIKRLEPKM